MLLFNSNDNYNYHHHHHHNSSSNIVHLVQYDNYGVECVIRRQQLEEILQKCWKNPKQSSTVRGTGKSEISAFNKLIV
ncbi:Cystic fibrosis transmembrane conductance regulator [Trichinella spiralis]|uniref:Cystic fibrosis transmembrane conductance regulator n=1 Tax=Trichinella spiralis TaxID=6334 RepID=A0ABR3KT56_TRISP